MKTVYFIGGISSLLVRYESCVICIHEKYLFQFVYSNSDSNEPNLLI